MAVLSSRREFGEGDQKRRNYKAPASHQRSLHPREKKGYILKEIEEKTAKEEVLGIYKHKSTPCLVSCDGEGRGWLSFCFLLRTVINNRGGDGKGSLTSMEEGVRGISSILGFSTTKTLQKEWGEER